MIIMHVSRTHMIMHASRKFYYWMFYYSRLQFIWRQNFTHAMWGTISNHTKALKGKKSEGIDGITSEVLKIGAPLLVKPLTKIINQSLITGRYPTKWKCAKVVRTLRLWGNKK